MDKPFRLYNQCDEKQISFSHYMKLVQMFIIPEQGYKNVASIKLSITDLIILTNEEPEKIYKRINYAIKNKLISSKSKSQRIYEISNEYILHMYEDKYRFTNYFISAAIYPIIFFKNIYYPEELYIRHRSTSIYKDLNRYLFDIDNVPYINRDLYDYYYKRGINIYDKETFKRNCRIVTCSKNKLY